MSRAKPEAARLGNATKAKQPAPALQLVDGPVVPAMPEWLEAGTSGAVLWEQIWIAGGHHYDPTFDRQLVERYCEITDELDEVRAALVQSDKERGSRRKYLSTGSMGQVVMHPLRKDLKELRKELLPLEKELGKTPEARHRLGMALEKHRSVMDEVRAGAKATFVDVDDV